MRKRRTFTREFKRETACLVLDQGFSVKEVCEQFDLQDGALRCKYPVIRPVGF